MASTSRRTVLTGVGVINPLGVGAEAYWRGFLTGRGCIRAISNFNTGALPTRIGAEILGFDARKFLDKKAGKQLRVMARGIQLAVAAAQLALDHGRVDKEQLDPTRFGVEFGAGLLATELEELGPAAQMSVNCQPGVVDLEKWGEVGIPNITPLWMLKYLPNMLACHISILHNAQGPNNTITESDVASLLALGEAKRIVQRQQADFFLVGGADSKMNPLSMVRQCLFAPLSRRNETPERAMRPFDRHRDGTILGEGATVVILENLAHAQKRGARIYAEIVGFGSAFDRNHDGAGLARAVEMAFQEAHVGPEDIDHVNAHGLSTPRTDAWEAQGLVKAFATTPVPVFAPKSYFGNLGAGSGLSELAASVLALQHGQVPATLNYEEFDPDCPVAVGTQVRALRKPYVLKVGFTEMGQCAAVVLRKWE